VAEPDPAIRVADAPARNRYEIYFGDELAGFATYHRAGGVTTMIHTEIDDAFEHHGLGGILARAALDDIRARGERVRPDCPFVRGYIERHPEYADLVATR
jgi:uncharacterized protein